MLLRRQFLFATFVIIARPSAVLATATSLTRGERIAQAAQAQVGRTLIYDSRYARLTFPMGDVPLQRGVCADVVVRALREAIGVDLQLEIHRDMRANFSAYPQRWGLRAPDPNIDHRRVPNLERYFERRGYVLRQPGVAQAQPGDIVAWRLDNGLPHIGVVSASRTWRGRHKLVHNIGAGAQVEDVFTRWRITGHYRLT